MLLILPFSHELACWNLAGFDYDVLVAFILINRASLLGNTSCSSVPQDTPVADAKPDDIKDLLGGALFKALFKWMQESGPVYLLPTGALHSALSASAHVMQGTDCIMSSQAARL